MVKAKAHPNQLGFSFEVPLPASGPAALAGIEQRISRTVGSMIASDGRAREIIAAEMSVLLDEEVSRPMLDAYSSPAREGHKVPMSRFLALVAVTARHDLFDPILREVGIVPLVGDEVHTARLGQIDRHIEQLKAERRKIAGLAPMIRGE